MDTDRERLRQEIFPKSNPSNPPRQTIAQLISPARLKRIQAKEVRKYAASIDKKWRNWFRAMEE